MAGAYRQWLWTVAVCFLLRVMTAQYIGEEDKPPLPEEATLDGKVTRLNELSDVIYLNKSRANLVCGSGAIEADVAFNEPFNGVIFANNDRSSPCVVHGTGAKEYHVQLPLKGCGTRQGPARVFTNDIHIQFHPTLEWEGDEVVTLVCRYPPPVAPLPPAVLAPVIQSPEPPLAIPPHPRLSEVEILLIICAILFLALLLVGLGFSYFCLKKRNIKIVRRRPVQSLGPGSEITKLTGSTLSMFDGLKIPRAHATSTSGSEAALVTTPEQSDTLPSDYPSESPSSLHSEVEDIDVVQRGGDLQQHVNRAYLETEDRISTMYADTTVHTETERATARHLAALMAAQHQPEPQFDVAVRVRQPERPLRTPTPELDVFRAQERQLTTILEREEARSWTDRSSTLASMSRRSDLHTPPREEPAVAQMYAAVHKHPVERDDMSLLTSEYASEGRELSDYEADDQVAKRRANITSHTVDDRYLSTITETKVLEDIERRRREIVEFHTRPKALPPPEKWDVAIRTYAPEGIETDNASSSHWEESSVPGSEYHRAMFDVDEEEVTKMEVSEAHLDIESVPKRSWDVLIRVLEPPEDEDDAVSVLTEDDRERWRQILSTESTLRTMLTEATVKEDYERIRQDQRYERLFDPQKWDVIIRVLAPPPDDARSERAFSETSEATTTTTEPRVPRYRKRSDYDGRARRSYGLPTEYDSDGNPIRYRPGPGSSRSRRTSKSSLKSEMDVRSMTEEVVNFSRHADRDDWSDDHDFADGLSRRSLARSGSEFTEAWGAEGFDTSPDASPRDRRRFFERSSTEMTIEESMIHTGADRASSFGDREEMYSVAETEREWMKK